jgi:acyl-CoA synthetase (AMP-forming)/AMP-acid ligase II
MRIEAEPGSRLVQDIGPIMDALRDRRPLVVRTSGTTGPAKSVEVDVVAAWERKRPGDAGERWLLTYSPARWAGISVVLHAVRSGCVLCVPETLEFGHLLRAARTLLPTHLSCTPSMLRNLVRHDTGGVLRGLPFVQVTLGGEAATQPVLDLARAIWPHARVSHVYASTELGDICAVSDGLAGLPRQKFDGFELSPEGELIVRGTKTGDYWELRGDRYHFLGRKEEIINVGGNKISPLVLEDFAIGRGAQAARAFAVPSALMGSLVGMEYVGGPEEKELGLAFRSEFPKYACPAVLKRVEVIPLSEAGKTRRTA